MRIRVIAVTLALSATMTATATAADAEVIEPVLTGPPATFGMSTAQSFTPSMSGVVHEVMLWAQGEIAGRDGALIVHLGDRPGIEIQRTEFVWSGLPTTVSLAQPLVVTAGQAYTLQATGALVEIILGGTDPYPNGEFVLGTSTGWVTWSERNNRCDGGCSEFVLDQRFSLEVVSSDADGDGVLDVDDRCADTVLPDPSVATLGRNRYAATSDGVVGFDGVVLASLAETGGCSTAQIVEILELGNGHLKFGLTRPHVERWIAGRAGS